MTKLFLFLFISSFILPNAWSMTCLELLGNTTSTLQPSQRVIDLVNTTVHNSRWLDLRRKLDILYWENKKVFSIQDLTYIQSTLIENIDAIRKAQSTLSDWTFFFSSKGFFYSNIRFIKLVEENFIKYNSEYSAQDTLNILFLLQIHNRQGSEEFQSTLTEHFNKARVDFSPDELTKFIKLYSDLYGFYSSTKVVLAFQKAFQGLHQKFNSSQIATVFYSLTKIRIKPSQRFSKLAQKAFVESEKSHADDNIADLSSIYSSVITLGLEPTDTLYQALIQKIERDPYSFETPQITSLIYSFYLIGDFDMVKRLVELFAIDFSSLKQSEISQFLIVKLYMIHVKKLDADFIEIEINDSNKATLSKDISVLPSEPEVTTADLLEDQGYVFEQEFIVSSGFPVDFYIEDHNLIVQVDGPHHYIKLENGELVLRVNDIRFNELHEALGYKVERVSFLQIGGEKTHKP